MIQQNEAILLILGVGVMLFIFENRKELESLTHSKILIAGFTILFVGWVFTVLEGFFLNDLLNFLEHVCYAASSVLIAVWCGKVFGTDKESP